MAWIDKPKKKYRLRDRISGQTVTVIRNLGIWQGVAQHWKVEYDKAIANGFTFTPPIKTKDIANFLDAKRQGLDPSSAEKRIPIEQMIEIYIKHQGPSVKGGIQEKAGSTYYNFRVRMQKIGRFWAGKYSDEITKYDVRDLLANWQSIGTRMRCLGLIGRLFNSFYDWNDNEPQVVGFLVKLPKQNPVRRWRKEMKASEKRELPDTRVLTKEEWWHFRKFLKPRTAAICEIALRRFLRRSDIERISQLDIHRGEIKGVQQKTGEPFTVPVLNDQPTSYDFRNFKREFAAAQVKAGMDWPSSHPMHFSLKDFRRTGATWAYQATKDLVGISKMLGHTNIRTTLRYLNINEADKARIASAVDAIARGKDDRKAKTVKSRAS